MPAISVLRADLSDPAHARGIVDCIDGYAADPMGGSHALDDAVCSRLVGGLLATPAARVWLAHDGERTGPEAFVGVVVAFVGYSTFAAQPRWNVHDVAVQPASRDQGVGRAMLEAVIADARESGCVAVALEVRHDNAPARHLYSSLGFGDGFSPMEFWVKPLD